MPVEKAFSKMELMNQMQICIERAMTSMGLFSVENSVITNELFPLFGYENILGISKNYNPV